MLRTTKYVEKKLRDFFRDEYDFTLPRFDVMAALYRSDKCMKMSELSGHLLVSNGNVTVVVDRLEKDGLITRTLEQGDRRSVRVCLTKQGRQLFAEMAERHRQVIDEQFAQLGHDELDSFNQLCQLMKHGDSIS